MLKIAQSCVHFPSASICIMSSGLTRGITEFIYMFFHGGQQVCLWICCQTRSGPHQVRPSVWDLRCFGIARPEPRPGTFISGQETLASVP